MFETKVTYLEKIGMKFRPLLLAVAGAGIGLVMMPASASAANTWYVSSLASGTVHNGTSWTTAWWDFSSINWTEIQPGDTIVIDAGPAPPPGYVSSVIYHTTCNVQQNGVTIAVSNQTGHNGGIASIQSGGSQGINIGNCSNVTVQGSKWTLSGFPSLVPNLNIMGASNGVYVGPQAANITLQNLSAQWCTTGLNLQGGQTNTNYLLISDNQTNVLFNATGGSTQWAYINNSWIYGDYYHTPGVVTSGNAAGPGKPYFSLYDCILGPGLSTAMQHNATGGTSFNVDSCLSINPTVAHLAASPSANNLFIDYLTGFMTPLNPNGQAHACLSYTETPFDYVGGSIFYGGVSNVTGNNNIGSYNFQYMTSGNTQVISPTEADPQFISNVSTVPNDYSWSTFNQLCNLNFAKKSTSPTGYAGVVSPTSVAQFLTKVPH